jgi:hypothetical protein
MFWCWMMGWNEILFGIGERGEASGYLGKRGEERILLLNPRSEGLSVMKGEGTR